MAKPKTGAGTGNLGKIPKAGIVVFFLVAAFIASIDQITKKAASSLIPPGGIPVVEGYFHLTLVRNTGAGFGLFQNNNGMLLFISLIVVASILFFLKSILKNGFLTMGTSFIFGGAAGNIIDRIMLGHVVDFLDFRIWPVFNAADAAITIGAILVGISLWKKEDER
ncbi:signal peptidase II [Candidatus Woesearchaeota archaeon]|nr:signal peptidase II [Candidatus Woesearchaeota archaeon]